MTAPSTADIAVIGLGVMGANLARNFASRGWTVAVYNRTVTKTEAFMAEHGAEGDFVAAGSLAELAATLKAPRKAVIMVKAGRPVDLVIDGLSEVFADGDIVIDGGNSHWPDTERREATCRERSLRFVGMGVSGGEEGALKGPSMMPGGDASVWPELKEILTSAAAVSDSGPCVAWCGERSAGHYVKMVHNGIEYGDMQLIAEVWSLMRRGLEMSPQATREVFSTWNAGRLESYLIDITARIVAAKDPHGDGALVGQILDVAGQKGTGRWTVRDAIERGIPTSTITSAVDGRALSARKAERLVAAARFPEAPSPLEGVTVEQLEQALYAAKLMSYTQGFDLLRTTSREQGYGTDLAEVARMWKAGCIIRAAFLDRVYEAYRSEPDLPFLCLAPTFAEELRAALPGWRAVVAAAARSGLPTPALATSLAWFDTLRTGHGTASLIQAQRDFFGAHTYRRLTDPDTPVHSEWAELEQL